MKSLGKNLLGMQLGHNWIAGVTWATAFAHRGGEVSRYARIANDGSVTRFSDAELNHPWQYHVAPEDITYEGITACGQVRAS